MEMNASGTRRKLLTRWLGTVALVGLYCLSLIGVSGLAMTSGSSSALARGRGGGGRGGGGRRGGGGGRGGGDRGARGGGRRGGGRGGRGRRGRGIGFGIYDGYSYGDDNCWWSPRRARWICPYYD